VATRFLKNVCTPALRLVGRTEFSLFFSLLCSVQTGSGTHKDTFIGYRLSFLRLMGPGRDDHTPPSADVKNEYSYVSRPSIYLDDVSTGKCTFTLVSLSKHTTLRYDCTNHMKAVAQGTICANTVMEL
jgi:hypothetical protein